MGISKGYVRIDVDETNTLQVRARNEFEEPDGAIFREFVIGVSDPERR